MKQRLKKIATNNLQDIRGRTSRKDFWIIFSTLGVLSLIVFFIFYSIAFAGPQIANAIVGKLLFLILFSSLPVYGTAYTYILFVIQIRRLHDIGKSGWWITLGLIPFLGMLILLFLYKKKGELSENKYGPNPKEVTKSVVEETPPKESMGV